MPSTLYLIPTGLGGVETDAVLPAATHRVVTKLRHFIVEDAKSARAFLKSVRYPHPLQSTIFSVLNEHTPQAAAGDLLLPLQQGTDCGLLSEAGCPGIADPGAAVVRRAHAEGIRVVPLVGPSSILLALMASGLNGQRFAFHGYLPVDRTQRAKRVVELERASDRDDMTQLFIETPYRNESLLQTVLEVCHGDTLLCIAADITLPSETIETRTIAEWKKTAAALQRRPAVFLLYRNTN